MSHILVPEHKRLSEADKKVILEKYNVTEKGLPSISQDDPAIAHLKVKVGDVIEITRSSPTAGKSIFYRSVV